MKSDTRVDADDPNTIVIFSDGSCWPNPNGPGGWAFYCTHKGKSAIRHGYKKSSTNNEMELMAILHALRYVPHDKHRTSPILIFTDSKYCKNSLTDWVFGWKAMQWKTANGSPVKNKKVIAEIDALIELHSTVRTVEIRWVRGHSGVPENELVDQRANMARVNKESNWKSNDHKTNVTKK